jgi:hypothetical protein
MSRQTRMRCKRTALTVDDLLLTSNESVARFEQSESTSERDDATFVMG